LTKKIQKTRTTKTKKGFKLENYMIVIGIFILLFLTYIGYRINNSEGRLIPISVIALILGVIYESKRITEKWSTVLYSALGSFLFSFLAFLPGKRERIYNFENHIEMWPYTFIVIFIIITIAMNEDKIIPKLTEGITLMKSVAIIYWVIDYGFVNTENVFILSLMIVGVLFAIFSAVHAFTHIELTRTNRLILSVWSSIILVLFALDNIYRVYQNDDIENTNNLINGIWIGIQYFLLGISSVYIVQNMFMLIGFLPGKQTFFNAQYYRDLKELKNQHIKRYSEEQISILNSIFCILFTSSVFYLNYKYQILPRHTAIWLVFVLFPIILFIYDYLKTKNYR
jgi:hypothetical protein